LSPGLEGQGSTGILKKWGLASEEYLLFLGSLEPRKYFDAVLAGYETYRKFSPSSRVKLVMAGGTGWKNFQLEKKIRSSPWAGEIVRTGYVSDSELCELMDHTLALMMISQYEGYGLPVAQAFSRGRPVITSLGSSLPEACGGEGIFVEPYDPFSVCAGIQRALLQPLLQKDSEVRRQRISQQVQGWTWRNYARELLGLIQ
jgi:glycosyltransferase involved in cell wall biosynthesis